MRRKDREVTDPGIIAELLGSAEVCRIAMVDNGEPYVIPLNYGYCDNALYIHSAAAGRKIQILKRNSRVCFEIESPISIVRDAEACRWGTRARSLIGYGNVEIVTDREQKKQGLDIIMRQHGKKDPNLYAGKQLDSVVILKVVIESVTCKQLGDWS